MLRALKSLVLNMKREDYWCLKLTGFVWFIMKIIKLTFLLASLFAIAGAAFVQLFLLLANALFAQPNYDRQSSRLS